MKTSSPGRILISEPCSWDMDALGFPYLPYVWGVLKTYHEQHGRDPEHWEWLAPVYRYGEPHDLLRSRMAQPIDILGLSCYTWNWKLQCRIAAAVKLRYPECLVVAGGPHPDFADPGFFREHPFIDAIAVKDGEQTFTRILETWASGDRDLGSVRGLYLPGLEAAAGHRFTGPAEIPTVFEVSPYVAQSDHYEQVIRECGGKFCATWETNRGCPFRCSFCDWGSSTMSNVRRFAPERVSAELEWFGQHGVSVLFLADANFGMFPEDVELGRRVADTFRKYGCPASFSYNTAKNKPAPSVAISRALFDSGMAYKHTLSIQHTRPEVLAATDRKNISSEKQVQVVRELSAYGIPVEVQLILGIPGDTYALWQGCFGDLMEWGIHGQYQTYLYHLLPNAPAASAEFRRRWQMGTVRRCVYLSPHLGFIASECARVEKNDIVVSSATFGRDDWVRMNVYATAIKALHTTGLTQLVAHYLRRTHLVPYEVFYSNLIDEWASRTWWYERLTAHFGSFLTDEEASEFLRIEELPSYPHPVAAFQWLFVQLCLSHDSFFEALTRYLLVKYPQAASLASLLRYQKAMLILPDYDSRTGKTFATDLGWAAYFQSPPGELPLREPLPGSGGDVQVADQECGNGLGVFPLDWFLQTGEARWLTWIERVVLDYSCAGRGTFQNVSCSAAATAPSPAPAITGAGAVHSPAAGPMS
jgi:putative methyltransferase